MKYVDIVRCAVLSSKGGTTAPVIYIIDSPEHPFDVASVANSRTCTIVKVPVNDWNDSLTPWSAPGLYRGEADFGGDAAATLEELVGETIPAVEAKEGLMPTARGICGYSLGGLFALYALTHSKTFSACACLSGSVWYEGWVDRLRELDFDGEGKFSFLSIGSKEKHAAPKILHAVQDKMGECAQILEARGCETEFVVGPGNHMSFARERFDAGISALDAFYARSL